MTLSAVILTGKRLKGDRSLEALLKKQGLDTVVVEREDEALRRLSEGVALVLIGDDVSVSHSFFQKAREISPEARIIVVLSPSRKAPKTEDYVHYYLRWPAEDEDRFLEAIKRAIFEFSLAKGQRSIIQESRIDVSEYLEKIKKGTLTRDEFELEILRSLTSELSTCSNYNNALVVARKYIDALFETPIFCTILSIDRDPKVFAFMDEIDIALLKSALENLLNLNEIFTGGRLKLNEIKSFFLNGKAEKIELLANFKGSPKLVQSHITFPLVAGGENLGCASICTEKKDAYGISDIRLFSLIASQLASALQTVKMFTEVQRIAIRDSLTGLYNRGHFDQLLDYEYLRAKRYSLPLSFIILDVDNFKIINDTYGHLAGDKVLREMAKIIRTSVRQVDIVARFGGEEFVVLLPNTSLDEAAFLAERLRDTIQNTTISVNSYNIRITVSAGVATLTEDMKSKEEFVYTADRALLLAKSLGRNRICMHIPERGMIEMARAGFSERRKFPRVNIKLPIEYSRISLRELEKILGKCQDISEVGIAFEGSTKIPKGEFALLEITVPSEAGDRQIKAIAQVVWNKAKGDKFTMGAKLVTINPEDRQILRDIVKGVHKNEEKR